MQLKAAHGLPNTTFDRLRPRRMATTVRDNKNTVFMRLLRASLSLRFLIVPSATIFRTGVSEERERERAFTRARTRARRHSRLLISRHTGLRVFCFCSPLHWV